MSQIDPTGTAALLADTVTRALADVVTPAGTLQAEAQDVDPAAWRKLDELGLVGAACADLSLRELAAIVQAIGQAGALVPFADNEAIARWLAVKAGIDGSGGGAEGFAVACVPAARVVPPRDGGSGYLLCTGLNVAWARQAHHLLVPFDDAGRHYVGLAPVAALVLVPQANLAGEPMDLCGAERVAFERVVPVDAGCAPRAVMQRGALLRAAAMIGAANRVLALAIRYAQDRKQFGRSLSAFQVIQSHLAEMAGECTAAGAMLETALAAIEASAADGAETAALKVRVGQAARTVAALSHQIHGAIGFTQEYELQLFTRRLWAWREEYGNESHWAMQLGATLLAVGADNFWSRITQ